MNFFYCNGLVSIITASALIKEKFQYDKNILIIEKDSTTVFPNKFTSFSNDYNIVLDIFTKTSIWDELHEINVKTIFISFEDLVWPISSLPFTSTRLILNRKKTVNTISDILSILTKKDKLFVSDNSILWRYFYKNQCDLSFIEHGAASYRPGEIKKNWKYFLKTFYSLMIRVNLNATSKVIYLSDNLKSNKYSSFMASKHECEPISINLESEIEEIFVKFIEIYKSNYSEAYKELLDISKQYENKNLYIYHPTTLVPSLEYKHYLNAQLLNIKSNNNAYLIKNHLNDIHRDYNVYFEDLNLENFSFNVSINNALPTEILLFFLNNSTLFASYTSSHLYSRWWLNKKTIFAEVKESSVNETLIREYYAVYDDMQKF